MSLSVVKSTNTTPMVHACVLQDISESMGFVHHVEVDIISM